jgi:hypothetical protein
LRRAVGPGFFFSPLCWHCLPWSSPENNWIEKLIVHVPSESAPQRLSNEWSCQYVSTILIFWDNFCDLPLVTEVTISP